MEQAVDLTDYNDLTHRIIGCAMTVHRKLGLGFPEVVYQWALAIELFKQGLKAEQEVELSIYYGNEKVGSRRADFFVDGRVLVEMKAVLLGAEQVAAGWSPQSPLPRGQPAHWPPGASPPSRASVSSSRAIISTSSYN